MMSDTRLSHRAPNRPTFRWAACTFVALVALAGCKSGKDAGGGGGGMGVSRNKDKDPLVFGPTKIPKQDLPLPDRAIGKGKADPLTTPTGSKTGYMDGPERFQGTFIPGKSSTPAALSGRPKDKDDEGLKIDDSGVKLAGGTQPGGSLGEPEGVSPLYAQLERYGVTPQDRTLEREGGKYVFRAATVVTGNGARRQYVGMNENAVEAVRKVLEQVVADEKK